MLNIGCTLPNLANICLQKTANYNFHPVCKNDEDLCEKIRDDLTRKAVVDEGCIQNRSLEMMQASFTHTQCIKISKMRVQAVGKIQQL